MVLMWLVLTLFAKQVAAQGYGPDPSNVPSDFMCGWRRLALNYTKQVRPDAVGTAYDALELATYCGDARPEPAAPLFPPSETPAAKTAIYVDAVHGSDKNPGTKTSPKQTAQAALSALHSLKPAPTTAAIIFRGGKHYLERPLEITAKDENLTLQNYPGEEAWLSGAQDLVGLDWKPYDVKSGRNIWQADLSAYNFANIPELRVNGERVTPARYPNANVEKDIWPKGYLTSEVHDWIAPKISPSPNPALVVNISKPNRNWDSYFSHYSGGINGTCSIYDPPFSYWCMSPPFSTGCGGCFTWNIPGGLNYKTSLNKTYKHLENAVVFAWRKAHWANWAFELESYHPENSTFIFGKGGFQGARGGPGSDWYISHVLEELDAPTEYYFSPSTKQLYYFPDQTKRPPPASTRFEAVVQHTLVQAVGTQAAPVKGLRVLGLGFRDTASTMLEPHGVPSGGDWALERMAALFLEGVESPTVEKVKMWKIGGNGLMLSKYAHRASVVDSEFVWLGGTAIAAWGWTDEISDGGVHGIDGTGGDFPRYSSIERNVFREIGIWEKQASGFFQAKAAQTTLRHNVAFNLARAGFNFNDGFGGGDEVIENVLFNTCRESSDHGPINSWDRQPFLTTVRDGTPSTQMAWRDVTRNIVIANYGGSKEVDNDDGSLFYRVHHNFMAYGWAQKFKCGGIESFNNVKAFIDTGGKFDAGCAVGSKVFAPNLWHNDTMVHLGGGNLSYRSCWRSDSAGHDWDKTQVQNNTIYLQKKGTHAIIQCGRKTAALPDFQAEGNEPGSREIYGYPSTENIMKWARETIGKQWVPDAVHGRKYDKVLI